MKKFWWQESGSGEALHNREAAVMCPTPGRYDHYHIGRVITHEVKKRDNFNAMRVLLEFTGFEFCMNMGRRAWVWTDGLFDAEDVREERSVRLAGTLKSREGLDPHSPASDSLPTIQGEIATDADDLEYGDVLDHESFGTPYVWGTDAFADRAIRWMIDRHAAIAIVYRRG